MANYTCGHPVAQFELTQKANLYSMMASTFLGHMRSYRRDIDIDIEIDIEIEIEIDRDRDDIDIDNDVDVDVDI